MERVKRAERGQRVERPIPPRSESHPKKRQRIEKSILSGKQKVGKDLSYAKFEKCSKNMTLKEINDYFFSDEEERSQSEIELLRELDTLEPAFIDNTQGIFVGNGISDRVKVYDIIHSLDLAISKLDYSKPIDHTPIPSHSLIQFSLVDNILPCLHFDMKEKVHRGKKVATEVLIRTRDYIRKLKTFWKLKTQSSTI